MSMYNIGDLVYREEDCLASALEGVSGLLTIVNINSDGYYECHRHGDIHSTPNSLFTSDELTLPPAHIISYLGGS